MEGKGDRISQEDRCRLRERVVLLREKGMPSKQVAQEVGLCVPYVSTIWQQYKKGGLAALKPKGGRRGRKHGAQRKLSTEQEDVVRKLLLKKTPDQLGLRVCLWTREALQLAIKQESGVELPVRTISDYLKRWNIAIRMPSDRGRENGDGNWKECFREVREHIGNEKLSILWCGDTRRPRVDPPNNMSINMIWAAGSRGTKRFMLYQGAMNEDIFIRFLSGLAHDCKRKVILVMHYHPMVYIGSVHDWLLKRVQKIELYRLESNLPENNPDEADLEEVTRKDRTFEREKELLLRVNKLGSRAVYVEKKPKG